MTSMSTIRKNFAFNIWWWWWWLQWEWRELRHVHMHIIKIQFSLLMMCLLSSWKDELIKRKKDQEIDISMLNYYTIMCLLLLHYFHLLDGKWNLNFSSFNPIKYFSIPHCALSSLYRQHDIKWERRGVKKPQFHAFM